MSLRQYCGKEMNDQPLQTRVFEALGEASMQWNPRPTGIFDSSNCERIGNELWDAINAELVAEENKRADWNVVIEDLERALDALVDALTEINKIGETDNDAVEAADRMHKVASAALAKAVKK